jgi:hypothetical protein
MKKTFFVLFLSLFITSCEKGPILHIKSTTPARIEKNGVQVCDSTPCTTGGYFYADPVIPSVCVSGADTRLEAFPLQLNNGFNQSKIVSAECEQTVEVFFDMNSGGIVNTIKQDPELKNESISKKLTLLKDLRKKNLISEQEYKEKKKEILDSMR